MKTHAAHIQNESLTLKEKLKKNREKQGTGSGNAYWDSVVDVIKRHYDDVDDLNDIKLPW